MKKLLYLLIACVGFYSCSPTITPSQTVPFQPLEYEAIIEAPGLSEGEILKRVSRVIVKSYNDYQSVFQYRDSSFLAINAGTSASYYDENKAYFTKQYDYQFIAQSKVGRCKLSFSRFKYYYSDMAYFKQSTSTKEVAVKNLMYERGITLEERNKKLEIINLVYDQLNAYAKDIIQEIEQVLNDPSYDAW